MAARFEKTLVMNYLLKMHGLGAAAPGELPGELPLALVLGQELRDPSICIPPCMPSHQYYRVLKTTYS